MEKNDTGNTFGALQDKGHIIYFDLLRLVALFLVVMLHVAARVVVCPSDAIPWRFGWDFSNVYDSLCRCAVPIFVMISGALFLGREIPVKRLYSKYVIRIVRVFAIWTVFYAIDALLLSLRRHDILLPVDFACICLKGHYHLWFLFMIAFLYLIVPFLRKIAEDMMVCRLFLLLGFVFALLVPQTVSMVKLFSPRWGEVCETIVSNMNAHYFLGYSVYFMWGYWLHKQSVSDKRVWTSVVLGVVGVVITIGLTSWATKSAGKFDGRFYVAPNVTVFLPATAIFVACKHWLAKARAEDRFAHVVTSLAQHSFGAYLIHAFVLEHLERSFHLSGLAFHPLVAIPVTSLVAVVLSLLAAALLARIPYVGKWLF